MTDATASLARSITWASSKQSYYTAHLMVDRDLVDDCYRAYSYLRWADDIIDISSQSSAERVSFIEQQIELINRLYSGDRPDHLTPEEEMLAELISHDRGENSGLQSFIRNFVAVLEFDARRKGQPITQQELTWYASCLGKAVTDGILYFVGNGHPYPSSENRYLSATAAHITHMLRDMVVDTIEGFINIPREYLEESGISHQDVGSPPFQAWVRSRVEQAREYFRAGKQYLDKLEVLRCKIVGYWYCHRFEVILDAIERDGYALRAEYEVPRRFVNWLRIGWLAFRIFVRHIVRPRRRARDP